MDIVRPTPGGCTASLQDPNLEGTATQSNIQGLLETNSQEVPQGELRSLLMPQGTGRHDLPPSHRSRLQNCPYRTSKDFQIRGGRREYWTF